MRKFAGLLLLLSCHQSFAETYMSYMGGGGEPKGPETIFDPQVKALGDLQAKKNWPLSVTFNGGHATTEALLKTSVPNVTNTPFTKDSFLRSIDRYVSDIKSGKIKSGDQVMVVVDTHGGPRSPKLESTHAIAVTGSTMTNLNTGEGAQVISMDHMAVLAKLAKEKNIKLAIVDLSCHSGSTLALQNENTCVITATGPNHFGNTGNTWTFSYQFMDNLKKKKNLEEAFLEARFKAPYASFPMISTPAGLEVNRALYEKISPFLFDADEKINKLTPYLMSIADEPGECSLTKDYDDLMKLIDQTKVPRSFFDKLFGRDKSFQDLKNTLKDYYDYLKDMIDEYRAMKLPPAAKKESFCSSFKAIGSGEKVPVCQSLTLDEIIGDQTAAEQRFEALKPMNPSGIPYYNAELAIIKQVKARASEILSEYPDLKRRKDFFLKQPQMEEKTELYSRKVAIAQKRFYQQLYKESSKGDTRPNPCREFKL